MALWVYKDIATSEVKSIEVNTNIDQDAVNSAIEAEGNSIQGGLDLSTTTLFLDEPDANISGFADYADLNTQSNPLALVAGVWTKITNDGAAYSVKKPPANVSDLWDSVNNKVKLENVEIGRGVRIRAVLCLKSDSPATTQNIFLKLLFDNGSYSWETVVKGTVFNGSDYEEHTMELSAYVGSEDIVNNGLEILAKAENDAHLKVKSIYIHII